jgi:multidrug efflux pump subunit AcrB
VDLRIQQAADYPRLNVDVDRTKAQLFGLTQLNVASNMLISLAGSVQTQPSFWIDPVGGTQYSVVSQTPQYDLETQNQLAMTPLTNGSRGSRAGARQRRELPPRRRPGGRQPLRFAAGHRYLRVGAGRRSRVHSDQVNKVIAEAKGGLPKGSHVVVRGQVQTMKASFFGLLVGLLGAVVLVYLLIVVNFQSWLDPFIIITALPAALAGIVWMLFLTHTTVSVPALTGAIMCMGVATANSVLMVSFARERMDAGDDPAHAASQAGFQRFRPVLMTALAMIIGMVPMALGLGDGGEQNAPLGRAVIGGLVFATVATLFFVPAVFAIIHGRAQARRTPHNLPEKPMSEPAPKTLRVSRPHIARYAWIALVVALILAAWGIISRVHARSTLAKETSGEAIPQVTTLKPARSPASEDLVLPGSVQAFIEAPIYARTSGYLKMLGTPTSARP